MIAVTVVTPSYRHLEKEAVKRIKKFTGLKVQVIRCSDKDGFMKKLELDLECPRDRIVFTDIDFWFLREVHFESWCPNTWLAVMDSAVFNPWAFPHSDCEAFGMQKIQYFNSGFFVCNLALKEHRKVFQVARRIQKKIRNGTMKKPVDVTDQFALNKAAQDTNVPMSLVPLKFNYYHRASQWGQVPYIPRDVIGLHAAGFKLEEKKRALEVQAEVFTSDVLRICPEAQQFEATRIFDMR